MNIEENKAKIFNLLKSTKRKGIDNVISELDKSDFYIAPASSKFHGNYDGGLAEHSLNVYIQAMYIKKVQQKIRPDIINNINDNSIILCSILHDICKIGYYKKVKKWRKDPNNKWEEYETYDSDSKSMPLGHGEKSVIMLLKWGLELTEEEMLAIRWHMGAFDKPGYYASEQNFNESSKIPLVSIISCSDMLATKITEA